MRQLQIRLGDDRNLILHFVLFHCYILHCIRNPLAVEEIAQSVIEFLVFDEDGPALPIQLVVHDCLDLIPLPRCFDLMQRGFLDHVKSFDVVLLEDQSADLLEECDLLEDQVDIELFSALGLAFIVFFHTFPVQCHSE